MDSGRVFLKLIMKQLRGNISRQISSFMHLMKCYDQSTTYPKTGTCTLGNFYVSNYNVNAENKIN